MYVMNGVNEKTQRSRRIKNVPRVRKAAKTGAERIREYRARIRALENAPVAAYAINAEGMAIETSQQNLDVTKVDMRENQRSLLYEALTRQSNQDDQEAATGDTVESVANRRKSRSKSKIKERRQRKKSPAQALSEDELTLVGKQENKGSETKVKSKRNVGNKRQKKDSSTNYQKSNTQNTSTKLIVNQAVKSPLQIDLSEALQLQNSNDMIAVPEVDNNDDENSILGNDMLQTEHTIESDGDNLTTVQTTTPTENPTAICKICKKSITNALKLNEHNESAHGRLLQCSMCAFNGMEYIVVEHMIEVHAGLDTIVYKCEKCEQTFSTNDECQMHQLEQHAHKDTTKGRLKTHMRIHEDNNEHAMQCNVCDKLFSTTQELAEHTYLHTGVRPYQCLYCHLSYTSRVKYNTHLRNMHDMVLNSQEFDQLCLQTLLNESSHLYQPYMSSINVSDDHEVLSVERGEECESELNSSESDVFVAVDPEIKMEIGENEIHF